MILEKKIFNGYLKNIISFCKKKINLLLFIVILIVLTCQILLWNRIKDIKPFIGITPNPPSLINMKAFSFGDGETYFRLKSYKLQNSGDTFGRFTPLKDYDYEKIYYWLINLDQLNSKSDYLASLGAYYYGQTQNIENVKIGRAHV